MTEFPATQHAIQITGVDEFIHNPAKPVDPVGPTQLLLKVESCGICFSDTKLLHAFDSHPRKAEVVSGIDLDALTETGRWLASRLGRDTGSKVGRALAAA